MTVTTALRCAHFAGRPAHSFNDIANRGERLHAMQSLVDARFAELHDEQQWSVFVRGFARFPRLSPANVFLVLDQHPAATRLRTHHGWSVLQRTPIERGIAVLIPSIRHKRVRGRTVWDGGRPVVEEVSHRPATMFDYTATAGTRIPLPWEAAEMHPRPGFLDDLIAAAATIGFAVETQHSTPPRGRRVFTLRHDQDAHVNVLALARDLGAAAGGARGAELFAYVLCTANGVAVPMPQCPPDPQQAVDAARSGLRRVLQRTTFRNLW